MSRGPSVWDDEELLEAMLSAYRSNRSASQIASLLNRRFSPQPHITRNAVIGKLHRMGEARPRDPSPPPKRKPRATPAVSEKRVKEIEAIRDRDIDTSDIPELTEPQIKKLKPSRLLPRESTPPEILTSWVPKVQQKNSPGKQWVPLLERTGCAFPDDSVSPTVFCNKPRWNDTAYCKECYDLMHRRLDQMGRRR